MGYFLKDNLVVLIKNLHAYPFDLAISLVGISVKYCAVVEKIRILEYGYSENWGSN